MVSAKDSKNLLVDWLNKRQATNVQTNLNKNSATNASNPTLTQVNPQTDLKAWTKSKLQEKNIVPATTVPISVNPNIIQQKASQNWVDPTGNANIMRFNAVTNNTNAGTNNFVPSTSPQSRFIGFQNLPQNTNTQQPATNPLYIETEETKAKFQNLKENIKHRTNSQALMDFQGDVLKNKGKMSKEMMERLYPEFKDNIDVLDELQKELRPIVQDGYGVDTKQLENLYPELLQAKNLKNVDKIKKQTEESNKKFQELNTTVNKVLKSDWKSLSSDGMRYLEDARLLRDVVEEAKRKGIEGGANDYEIMQYFIEQSPELQAVIREMNALKLTKSDRANLGLKDSTILARASNEIKDFIREELWLNEGVEASQGEVESGIRATEILENKFGGQILSKVSTELGVPLDSLEKSIYRTYKDVQNWGAERAVDFVKSEAGRKTLEKVAGRKFTDNEYNDIIKKTESIKEEEVNISKQDVLNYQDIVNKEYEKRKAQNLDPYVEDFVNNGGSMTNMLLNGQFRSFAYKSAGEAAQNADNVLLMLGGTVAPEVVLPAMFADSYTRESQESFEELMEVQEKMGIPTNEAYDNAQKGSAVVGLASSLVEVGLEKVIGGVETTASKAFHDMLMKDFTERTTKMIAERGLMELLKQGATTQFKASLEEGLEEVFQQAIHNKAIQKYDPDQKITEGMLEAFEGGFYNWMNLLAGGGDIMSNIQANKESLQQSALDGAYNAGVNARKAVDTVTDIYNNVRNKVTGGKNNVTNNQANTENNQTNIGENQTNITDNQGQNTTIVPQNTAITPVNNNIQQQDSGAIELQDEEQTENKVENKNTAIKEGGLTNKVLEQLNGLDENTRERIKKNPYSVEESKNLIKEMDENPGIDFRDYQNGRYEEVLDTVLKKLEQKENKRSKDIGTLYDKLEEANAPVDVTELKNKVAEFQAQAEALEDIATPAEQAQIKTILENIEKIGDGTMDVWKVRKIADKRSKRSASSSYDGIGLIWDIRDAIDDVIVKGNPDMKEVDKSYSKVLKEIGEIKGKLFYKNGGLKSNAVSTIKNMMNTGNRLDLNNLEKYIPGIKKQLQAIDDSKFVYNAYTTGKGSRFISGIARGVFGNIGKAIGFFTGGWGGLVAGAVVDAGVDKAMVNLTRKALRDTITKETAASKAELERISKKIEEGEKLDAEDKARLKALGEKIMKNGEQMAKTKAEKEAWNKYMEEINDNITPQTTDEEQEKNKVTKKKATKKNKVTEKGAETKKSDNQKKAVTSDDNRKGSPLEGQPITDNITINDKNASLIDKNLEDLSATVDKQTTAEEFLYKLKSSMLTRGNSIYVTFDVNGQDYTLRISNHSAYAVHSKSRGHTDHNTSIVIKVNPGRFKANPGVNLIEYVYYPDTITDEKMKGIIKGIKDLFQTGEYTDTNYDEINQSPTPKKEENKSEVKQGQPKNKVTAKNNDILLEETPQIADEDTRESDRLNELEQNETPQTTEEEQTKNKVTAKKTEVTAPKVETKAETKSDGEHFSYDEYGEVMDKIGEVEKEINEKLDKQMEQERAEKMKRFNELNNDENTDRSDGSEIAKLAGELNNLTNKYDRLKEEELKKQVPELLKKKEELRDAFGRDWKAVLDNKFAEIEKPFNELKDEYRQKLKDELGLADDVIFTDKLYKSFTEEQKAIADRLNKEYADKYEELRLKTAGGEVETKEESKTKATANAKNKVTNITVTKGGNITPDNSGITGRFRNLIREEYNDMKEMGGLEKLYQQGKTDTIFRMQDLKETVNAMIDLTAYGLPEDFNIDYHDFTTQSNGQSIVEIQQILDKLEAGEDTKEFEDVYGDHMVEKKDGTYEWDVEELKRLQRDYIGNMLDWAYERAYGEEKEVDRKLVDQIQGDLEGVKMDSYDIKETEKMIDKMKELVKKYGEYWHQGDSNDQGDTFVRYATDIDNLDNNETAQIPTIFEEDLQDMNLRELEENETPQADEEEMNKVTKRQPEKPKNLVTSRIEDNFMEEQAKSFDTPEAFIESAVSKDYKVGDNIKGLGTIQDVTDTQVKINGQRFAKKILGDNIDNVTLSIIRSTLDDLQAKNKDISDIISARKKGLYLLSFIQNSKNKQHLADIGYLEPVGDSSGAEGFTTAKSHMRDYANLKHGVENAEKQLREYWESVNNEAKVSKPKNLVTNEVVENNKSKPSWLSLELTDIFSTAKEQLKKAKTVSMGAIGKVQQSEVKLDNGTVVTYIKSNIKGGNTESAIIRVYSPTQGNKSYVVTKEGGNIELREGGKILSDEEVSKAYDILHGKTGEVEVEDMKVDTENVENKKDPVNAFLDNNETTKSDPKMKYKYLSRLNDNTSWTDYNTDIKYNGTVADKIQQTVDSFSKLFADLKVPLRFSKNNYGNYIEAGSPERGMQSVNIGDDIEFEYAKFLYDNPEIRSTKEFKAEGLKEAIKKGNEVHKEVVKDAEELKEGLPLDPEKYVWQQPTADEGIDAVYEQVKRISDFYEAAAKQGSYPSTEQLKDISQKRWDAGDAIWSKLKFKSDRSKLYNDFITNIKEANGNEKQLRSIAKNLYIQKVKDDFKNNYNYPSEVTDKVPGLRTAKDDYERYLKGRDTSFSGKDPRIDYSDKDRIGAGIKRQDGNQITAAQRREIVNGVLEYAKYMGIDMKKMSEDAGVTYVHLNGKHPFLTSRAVGLFHGLFKSISVGADMESYREKEKGKGRDGKMETHTVPVVMAHEITHAIDSMFEWSLFSDTITRKMARNMNEGRRLGPYWHSKEEVTARMVEEYVDVMKGGEGYYDMAGYWSKEVFDSEIKPYVEQIFQEKFDGYRLTDKERADIKLDEAPKSKNSVTASDLNKITNR